MKQWKRICAAVTAAGVLCTAGTFGGGAVFAEDSTYGDLTYMVLDDGTIQIKDCDESATNVEIPAEINGTAVTSIGAYAFYECADLASVTIPVSVTSIGKLAFYGCNTLTSMTIPDGVTSIGDNAFVNCTALTSITLSNQMTSISSMMLHGCESLTSVTIPESVTSIGRGAFTNCTSLTNIVIPDAVKNIETRVFNGCTSLTAIDVAEGNAAYQDIDGVLYTKDGTTLMCCPMTKTACVIPDSVTTIEEYACNGCSELTEIVIPENVSTMGDAAFAGCDGLTNVVLPEGIKKITYNLFGDCTSLTSVTIPNSVVNIDSSAFHNCSLTSVTIPENVKKLEKSAFSSCNSLTEIEVSEKNTTYQDVDGALLSKDGATLILCPEGKSTYAIPKGVTTIDASAFEDCQALTSVTIPEGVASIGHYAFQRCGSLTNVTLPESLTEIGMNTFAQCTSLKEILLPEGMQVIPLCAFQGTGLTSIAIPDGVTEIQMNAFALCRDLTSITIPNSVTNIGQWAFAQCTGLTDVYYGGTEEEWNAITIDSKATTEEENGNGCLLNATIHYNTASDVKSTWRISKISVTAEDEPQDITCEVTMDNAIDMTMLKGAVSFLSPTLELLSQGDSEPSFRITDNVYDSENSMDSFVKSTYNFCLYGNSTVASPKTKEEALLVEISASIPKKETVIAIAEQYSDIVQSGEENGRRYYEFPLKWEKASYGQSSTGSIIVQTASYMYSNAEGVDVFQEYVEREDGWIRVFVEESPIMTTATAETTATIETTTTTASTVSETTSSSTSSEVTAAHSTNSDTTTESQTTTTSGGATTVVTTETETTTEIQLLYGDVNLDGSIDLSDVVTLNKAVSGSVKLNDEQRANADCKAGGGISADDSMTLLQFLVHLIDALPVAE